MVNREKKHTTASIASEAEKDTWWSLEFEVDRMQLYHKMRYVFFRKLRKTISFLALLYSSFAIYSTINSFPTILVGSSVLMIVLFIFDIVFGLSDKEAKHYDLYKRYHALLTNIELSSNKNVKVFQKEYKNIEVEQPEILRALGFWCHNQISIAKEVSSEYLYVLSFKQKIFMNWFQFAHIQPKHPVYRIS